MKTIFLMNLKTFGEHTSITRVYVSNQLDITSSLLRNIITGGRAVQISTLWNQLSIFHLITLRMFLYSNMLAGRFLYPFSHESNLQFHSMVSHSHYYLYCKCTFLVNYTYTQYTLERCYHSVIAIIHTFRHRKLWCVDIVLYWFSLLSAETESINYKW